MTGSHVPKSDLLGSRVVDLVDEGRSPQEVEVVGKRYVLGVEQHIGIAVSRILLDPQRTIHHLHHHIRVSALHRMPQRKVSVRTRKECIFMRRRMNSHITKADVGGGKSWARMYFGTAMIMTPLDTM
jgi:hypothetical protein